MKFKVAYTLILIFYSAVMYGQMSPTWTDIFGFPTYGHEVYYDVAVDDTGNVYVTGQVANANGQGDILTRKYDWNGNLIWSVTYVPPIPDDLDFGQFIELDNSGNVIVMGARTGSGANDILVVIKYNNQGIQQWLKTRSTDSQSTDPLETMLVDDSDNIYVMHEGPNYVEIIKYNSAGIIQWTYHPNLPSIYMNKMELDLLGNLYITGGASSSKWIGYFSKLDSGGDEIWAQYFVDSLLNKWNNDVAISSDNMYAYVLGSLQDSVAFNNHLQIHKYDSSGTLLDTWTYPNALKKDIESNTGKSIRVDDSGNICFSVDGVYQNQNCVILGKYDTSGNLLWYDHMTLGLLNISLCSMTVDKNQNILVAGAAADSIDDRSYLAKYSDSGNVMWTSSFISCPGCLTYESLFSVETDIYGNIFTCGSTHNPNNSTNFDLWALLAYYQVCPPNHINNISHPSNKICKGDSILFEATAGITYQWYRNNILIPGATQQTYNASKRGFYKCYISQIDTTCSSFTNSQKVSIVCLPPLPPQEREYSDEAEDFLDISVSPNPSVNSFILNISSENENDLRIEIRDGAGREINTQIRKIEEDRYLLDQLSPGFYFATVRSGNLIKTIKLMQVE